MKYSTCSCFLLLWCFTVSSIAAGSCKRSGNVVRMCHGGMVSGSTVYLEADITAKDDIYTCVCKAVLKNASAINETRFVTSQLFPWPTCNYRLDMLSNGITVRIEQGTKIPSTFLLKNEQEIKLQLIKDKCKEKNINACSRIDISETSEDAEVELFCYQYLEKKEPTITVYEQVKGETTPIVSSTTSITTTTATVTNTIPIIHSNLETPHTFPNTSIHVQSDNNTNSSKFILHLRQLDSQNITTTTITSRLNTVFLSNRINVVDVEKVPPTKKYYSQTVRVGGIIGVVLAILLLGLLGVMLGYFYRRSRRKAANPTNFSNCSLVTHYVRPPCYVPYSIPQQHSVMRSCFSSVPKMGSNMYLNRGTC